MSRRTDRRHAFILIFQSGFRSDIPGETLFLRYFDGGLFDAPGISSDKYTDLDYVRKTFTGVLERKADIDTLIAKFAIGWELGRLIKTDLAVLRLAVYEMVFDKSVPTKVAINEALEICKLYGGDDSPAFVNGLLGQVAKSHGL